MTTFRMLAIGFVCATALCVVPGSAKADACEAIRERLAYVRNVTGDTILTATLEGYSGDLVVSWDGTDLSVWADAGASFGGTPTCDATLGLVFDDGNGDYVAVTVGEGSHDVIIRAVLSYNIEQPHPEAWGVDPDSEDPSPQYKWSCYCNDPSHSHCSDRDCMEQKSCYLEGPLDKCNYWIDWSPE
ncbi:MAG TPA: hypothetical protein PKE29_04570 [Phycisphaerales bacterium]|nr:hypothetical protein [Phycisphaerales bacterium]